MDRRKSKRKPPQKVKSIRPLDQQFNCPFCNNVKSCEIRMDKPHNLAYITCRVCLEDYKAKINYNYFQSEPIDIYHDWVDACEKLKIEKLMKEKYKE